MQAHYNNDRHPARHGIHEAAWREVRDKVLTPFVSFTPVKKTVWPLKSNFLAPRSTASAWWIGNAGASWRPDTVQWNAT